MMINRVHWLEARQWATQKYGDALRSDFLRKVVATFATRVFQVGLGLVTGVIVTRTLGPEGRGLYATAVTIGAIGVQFGNLGLHSSNTYYVAQNRDRLHALLGNSLVVSLGLGGLGITLAWIFFTLWPQFAPLHGTLLLFALLWIPFGLAYLLLQNLLLGTQQIGLYNRVELITRLLSFALIVGIILARAITPINMFLASLATMLVGLLWVGSKLLVGGSRSTPSDRSRMTFSRELFQSGLRYGFKAYLAAFFAYMVLRVDLLMVKQMLGVEQVGYYSVATNTADLVLMLPTVIGTLLFPKLSAMSDARQKWRFTRQAALGVGLLATLLAIVAGLLAQPALTILYGKQFLPTLPAFLWLMPAIVAISVNSIFMNYFGSLGMPLITVYSPGIAALINILLNLWLLPRFGIVGASLSSVVAYSLMLIFSIVYIYQQRPSNDQSLS